MMKKGITIAVILIVAIVLIFGFWAMGESLIIRYAGKKVIAVVTEVPSRCDKYNHIKVLQGGVNYEVNISRSDCNKGIYKIGQKVELMKHDRYHELVWPESRPELGILITLGILALVYFTNRPGWRRSEVRDAREPTCALDIKKTQ